MPEVVVTVVVIVVASVVVISLLVKSVFKCFYFPNILSFWLLRMKIDWWSHLYWIHWFSKYIHLDSSWNRINKKKQIRKFYHFSLSVNRETCFFVAAVCSRNNSLFVTLCHWKNANINHWFYSIVKISLNSRSRSKRCLIGRFIWTFCFI